MKDLPTSAELQNRVRKSIAYYGGTLPNDAALVWDGYFAALLEWGLISVSDHEALMKTLPDLPQNPVIQLFLGWNPTKPEVHS
jgi:hypothetical protein